MAVVDVDGFVVVFFFLCLFFFFETCLLEGNQSSDVCVLEVYLI